MRDANLPFLANEFLEKFAGCVIFSFINFFLSYDQVELNKASRDLTGFMTFLGLMRITILPQRAINLVA